MQGMGSTQGRGTSGARDNRMTEIESQKNNRILEVLNDDQRKLAKRVFTMIRNERENGIRRFMK